MKVDNRRMVLFLQNCSPYLSGEKAAFPPNEARSLVERKIAAYADKKETTKVEEVVKVDDNEPNDADKSSTGETKEETSREEKKPKRKKREKRKERVRG